MFKLYIDEDSMNHDLVHALRGTRYNGHAEDESMGSNTKIKHTVQVWQEGKRG